MPSYLQNHFKVTHAQYEFIRTITSGCSERTYKLFCHILICNIRKLTTRADSVFIPVAWRFIDCRLKRANWKELHHRGLIEIKPYDRSQGLSREFKVIDLILFEFQRLGDLPAGEYIEQRVDLFSGLPTRRIAKSQINDFNRHPLPPLIRDVMRVFDENLCPFNCTAVEQYLAETKATLSQYEEGSPERIRELARYHANWWCWKAVLDQTQTPIENGVNYYSPAYDVAMSGRIYQKGGALQTCSRQMKSHAYSGIANLFNYDLQASHMNILIQLFEEACLDADWLIAYRDTPKNKVIYAEKAGLPVAVWKTCLLSLVMGAHLPRTTKNYVERDNTILNELAELAQGDEVKLKELLASFIEVVMPLVEQLEKWHEWLLKVYIHREKRPSALET